tara:strand:- start:124 stop:336 length:213 start_codon:yes stop_codon:yes gene_type:complete
MSPKIQAAVNIVLFVVTMFIAGVFMYWMLENFGAVRVGIAVTAIMLMFVLKMAYDAEVSRLESLSRLNRK